jgi:hypothetical protein
VLIAVAVPVPAFADDHAWVPPASPVRAEAVQAESISYRAEIMSRNQMGMTVTNYAFIGNNFSSQLASMEYPLGSAYEHLVRGGLWFGARAVDDNGLFIGVATGAVDARVGGPTMSTQQATEYTPAGREILTRSSLPNDTKFSPNAVSEKDFISTYSDRPAKSSSDNTERHRPMGILVRQENYAWSFSNFQHSVVFKFVIKNLGPPLADAWVGIYTELASGVKVNPWPPGGPYFNKKWLQYEDSLRLIREHYCELSGACNTGFVPYWVGIKLLGTGPEPVSTKQVTLAAWNWAPGDTLRNEDLERYALMSSGTITNVDAPPYLPGSGSGCCDPVELLAVGPFTQINPGDSVTVDFAFVGGADVSAIQEHARAIQRAYDRNYVVPVPPPSPRMRVVARDRTLDLYWDDSPESFADSTSPHPLDFEGYRVYVGEDRNQLNRVAQFDKATAPNDTTGFNTGFAAVRSDTVIDGVQYRYRYSIPSLRNGFRYFAAVTAYDLGTVEIESLESGISQNKTLAIPSPAPGEQAKGKVYVYPNPYRVEARWDSGRQVRDHYLWFTNLPERCTLRIYTLSGDLVYEAQFSGSQYHAEGTRGVYNPGSELDVAPPTLSGTTFAWNLITREGQAAATGLYLYSVEDPATGKTNVGKFVIVKSDRENF